MSWARKHFLSRFKLVALLTALLLCTVLLLPVWQWPDESRVDAIHRHFDHFVDKITNNESGITHETASDLEIPASHNQPELAGICADRYDDGYIDRFSERATSYCDAGSTANLICFSHKASDKQPDSFCIGTPAEFDTAQKLIKLDCTLRAWTEEDKSNGSPQIYEFPPYWYNTGPRTIFDQFIQLGRDEQNPSKAASVVEGFSFLVKREANNQNLWHTMLEIMSLTMSLEVLRKSKDGKGRPMLSDKDLSSSRVVFLDDLPDGPYYDLWAMSAGMPSMRIHNLTGQVPSPTKVVIPLPGGSNPFWQGDWKDITCGESSLLKAFSSRVLAFYRVHDRTQVSERPLTLTFILRKQKRRLIDGEAYLAALQEMYPRVNIQVIDFATLTLSEQIHLSHETDILVGVHGAGLTHGFFLPHDSTVVEILPPDLEHKGFDNMSKFLGHRYLRAHGSKYESAETNGDWQHDDVYIDKDQFLELLIKAIEASLHR